MHEQACKRLKIQHKLVAAEMRRDPEFAAMVTRALPKREDTTFLPLAPQNLLPFACSQCTDEEMAGVFGMELEQFKRAIEEDDVLKSVYKNGRLAGQATIRKGQYDQAVSGDRVMLQHLGKHILGQEDKATLKIEKANPLENEREMERVLAALIQESRMKGLVIDVEPVIETEKRACENEPETA